ncbi:MAG: LamG domain-containing protein, partial [bacterium]
MRTMTIFIFSALFVFLRTAAYGAWQISYAESKADSQDNYGLKFDGVYDMVSLPKNLISTPAAITIEARVKYRSSKSSMLVLSLEGAYGFYLNRRDPGTFTPFFDNPTSDNSNDVGYGTNLNNNQWHHLAAVHANGTTKIFVDGVLVGSASESLYDVNSLDRISAIGAQLDGRSSNFDSIVDEVRVWNIVRTADQIQANMNRRLTGTEPGLISYWRLDEGEGQIVHDMSARANHGYLGNLLEVDPADPTWVSTIELNHALSFDGAINRVRVLNYNGAFVLTDFTIECWVKIEAGGKRHQLIINEVPATKGTTDVIFYSFAVWSDETLRIFFQNAAGNQQLFGQTRLELGKVYHVAATFDAKTNALTLYLNGEIDGGPTIVNGKPYRGSQEFVEIGRLTKGVIDEFRMWKIARSQHEIRKAMRAYLQGNEPGLAGYWRFDEGEGQELYDLSPSKNHGHLGVGSGIDLGDPTWVLSPVEESLCNGIALPAAEAYGRINSSNQSHPDKVAYCFPDQPGHKLLSFQAYDIDTQDEVAVILNGTKVFDVPLTANNSWSGLLGVLLPDELIDDYDDNELIFDNTKNPPQSLLWGVRRVSVDPFFALPSAAAYGRIPGGDQAHPDKVVYFFGGQPADLSLIYEVYDIDNVNELEVLLNGVKIHDETPTANDTWSKPRTLHLPDALVNDAGLNVLIFDSPNNPPQQWYWGVRNVRVETAPQASLALNLSQSVIAEANMARDGQYLFDGRLTPPTRS